jgi:hypothetical protein
MLMQIVSRTKISFIAVADPIGTWKWKNKATREAGDTER